MAGPAFCAACGKALPVGNDGPRVVTGTMLPTTEAGAALVGDQLGKQMYTSSWILLLVGVLQLGVAAVVLALTWPHLPAIRPEARLEVFLRLGILFSVAAVFVGLFFWARFQPFPATVTGLCLYLAMLLFNIVTAVGEGVANGQSRGVGVGCLDIVVLAVLVKGITAANQQRRLRQQRPVSQ
jgi:hypothetical protein